MNVRVELEIIALGCVSYFSHMQVSGVSLIIRAACRVRLRERAAAYCSLGCPVSPTSTINTGYFKSTSCEG